MKTIEISDLELNNVTREKLNTIIVDLKRSIRVENLVSEINNTMIGMAKNGGYIKSSLSTNFKHSTKLSWAIFYIPCYAPFFFFAFFLNNSKYILSRKKSDKKFAQLKNPLYICRVIKIIDYDKDISNLEKRNMGGWR